jgi:hypothetical protein
MAAPPLLTTAPSRARVDGALATARDWLLQRQDPAGFWCGELEGDTTLESYMILLEAFFGRRGSQKSLDLARVIRDEVLPGGGWSQYLGGPPDLSVSCLTYLALKVAGDDAEDPHMQRSRTVILDLGGIEAANTNGVIWQPRSRLTIFPSYHLEGDYLNGPPVSSAASAPLTLGCDTTSDHCFVWLSYLEQVVTWDRRDRPLEPRKGFYTSLSVQEGGGPLGGDFNYIRVLPDVRGYFSLGEDDALTFSARLRVGELWPISGNPEDSAVVTRFYGGGANSMRGFNDRRLSPLLLVPAPASAPGVTLSLPIGGDGMIDGSFEVRYSLTQALRLATFVDYGQVTTGQVAPSDAGHLLWAVGLGLRYLTPIGPLRLDVARRLPFGRLPPLYSTDTAGNILPPQPYAVDEGCFGLFSSHPVTSVSDGLCVLQISIGEAY